ncbi:nicastrin-like [Tubulanus polymorphus]|uniref:nicastrin-like n=1 Tax=Tubulanus polymorphus TaxID=672921 RepID=UPI003DA657CB
MLRLIQSIPSFRDIHNMASCDIMNHKFVFFAAIISIYISLGCSDRIHKKVYVDFNVVGACFRRLNATQEIGCASSRGGDVGVVHYVETKDDLNWLINHGPHKPYVVVLPQKNFNMQFLKNLTESGKVNGILLTNANHSVGHIPEGFSPDHSCPNDRYGLYKGNSEYGSCKKTAWNKYGTGMAFMNFKMAVMALSNQSEVDFLINDCYRRFNEPIVNKNGTITPRDFPLCAAEVKTAMDGAGDTPTCIRRSNHITNLNADRYCDPLGDNNIFTTMKTVNKSSVERQEKSVIVVATRLDSFSMFDQMAPGADSVVTGVVTVLAAAQAIGKVKSDILDSGSKDIMFSFFQGEAYDYIGSSRMVYEMEKDFFPQKISSDWDGLANINLTHISEFIEVSQVGFPENGKLWLHTDPVSQADSAVAKQTNDLITKMKAEGNSLKVTIGTPAQQGLPPASFQSFLKKHNISGAVLTDHEGIFTNKYYNSRLDLAEMLRLRYPAGMSEADKYNYVTDIAKRLTNVATVVARTLYKRATNKSSKIEADSKTVANLLYCYLIRVNCELVQTVIETKQDKFLKVIEKQQDPVNLYVSVEKSSNGSTLITRSLLAYFTSDVVVNATKDSCKMPDNNQIYNYFWIRGNLEANSTSKRIPVCLRSLTNYSVAVSPAFEIKDYDWKSGLYSSWTESVWAVDAMSARVFLIPSQKQKTVTLSVGVITLLVVMLLVYFVNGRAEILFRKVL